MATETSFRLTLAPFEFASILFLRPRMIFPFDGEQTFSAQCSASIDRKKTGATTLLVSRCQIKVFLKHDPPALICASPCSLQCSEYFGLFIMALLKAVGSFMISAKTAMNVNFTRVVKLIVNLRLFHQACWQLGNKWSQLFFQLQTLQTFRCNLVVLQKVSDCQAFSSGHSDEEAFFQANLEIAFLFASSDTSHSQSCFKVFFENQTFWARPLEVSSHSRAVKLIDKISKLVGLEYLVHVCIYIYIYICTYHVLLLSKYPSHFNASRYLVVMSYVGSRFRTYLDAYTTILGYFCSETARAGKSIQFCWAITACEASFFSWLKPYRA